MNRKQECSSIIEVSENDLIELKEIPEENIFPEWWNEAKNILPKCFYQLDSQCPLPVCYRECELCIDNSCGKCQWSCYLHHDAQIFKPIRQCQCIFSYFYVNNNNKIYMRCNQFSCYGPKSNSKATLFCLNHAPLDFKESGSQNCLFYNLKTNQCCSKQPSYQSENTMTRIFCAEHLPKSSDLIFINTKQQKCIDCPARAYYGTEIKEPLHCIQHKTSLEFNVTTKYCEFDKCKVAASFGEVNTNKRQYCTLHANIINLGNETKIIQPVYQEHYNCIICKKTRASFGEKDSRVMYCTGCNPDKTKFIDLHGKFCIYDNCESYASYAKKDTKTPIYCTSHYNVLNLAEQKKYINVRKKCCENCEKTASYGIPGTKTSTHCVEHKKEGYVLLKGSLCEICGKQANYCLEGETKKRFCKGCLPNNSDKPAKSRKPPCFFIHPDTNKQCEKRRMHSFPGYPASHCKEHKWIYIFLNGDKISMCSDGSSRKHKLTQNGYRILPCIVCRDDQKKIFNRNLWKCFECDNKQ